MKVNRRSVKNNINEKNTAEEMTKKQWEGGLGEYRSLSKAV